MIVPFKQMQCELEMSSDCIAAPVTKLCQGASVIGKGYLSPAANERSCCREKLGPVLDLSLPRWELQIHVSKGCAGTDLLFQHLIILSVFSAYSLQDITIGTGKAWNGYGFHNQLPLDATKDCNNRSTTRRLPDTDISNYHLHHVAFIPSVNQPYPSEHGT